MSEKAELPRCVFCRCEIVEGDKLETSYGTVYLCFGCLDILRAVVHDFAPRAVEDALRSADERPKWERLQVFNVGEKA